MCEIHICYKPNNKKLTEKDVFEFHKLMCFGSAENDDAFGILTDKMTFKANGGYNSTLYKEKSLLESNFVIGHNRYSTTGKIWLEGKYQGTKEENHHPFRIKDLSLVHNGTIINHEKIRRMYEIKSEIITDSYVIIWLIDYFMSQSKKSSRQERIIEGIQETTKKLTGTYSVVLYDHETNKTYYFKENWTTFTFAMYDDTLIGTTQEVNLKRIYFEAKKLLTKEPKPEVIYLVSGEKKSPVKEIGKFETSPIITKYNRRIETEEKNEEKQEKKSLMDNILGVAAESLVAVLPATMLGDIQSFKLMKGGGK